MENSYGGIYARFHGALCMRSHFDYDMLVDWFLGMGVELHPLEPKGVYKLEAWIQYCIGKYNKRKKENRPADLFPRVASFMRGKQLYRRPYS